MANSEVDTPELLPSFIRKSFKRKSPFYCEEQMICETQKRPELLITDKSLEHEIKPTLEEFGASDCCDDDQHDVYKQIEIEEIDDLEDVSLQM